MDEPLYGVYLARNPDHVRPEREITLATMPTDLDEVVANVLEGPCPTPLFFAKHIAKQLPPGSDLSWAAKAKHVVLIRDPAKLIASWAGPTSPSGLEMSMAEIGVAELLDTAAALRSAGSEVVVVDADVFAQQPEGSLKALCTALGIPWDPAMLSWEPGPKECDGCWAEHWYSSVWASSGFEPPGKKAPRPFPQQCAGLLAEAAPFYEALRPGALQPEE